jgi:hypothetical protein
MLMAKALHKNLDQKIDPAYEYDVESFFWVAMWVVFCCGEITPDCSIRKWTTCQAPTLVLQKDGSDVWFDECESSEIVEIRMVWRRWSPCHQAFPGVEV